MQVTNLKLRCFLEGIEVPIVSANLDIQMDSPAQCQVQIPATDKALELLPRTLIHIFFDYGEITEDVEEIDNSDSRGVTDNAEVSPDSEIRDMPNFDEGVGQGGDLRDIPNYDAESNDLPLRDQPDFNSDFENFNRESAGPVGDLREMPDFDSQSTETRDNPLNDDKKWKTYFFGEVTGYKVVKAGHKRAMILQCLDPSNYWDTCYQYQVNVANLHGNATAHFVGAGTTVFDTFFRSSTSSIIDIVRRRPFSRPELSGLMGGLVHLLERVGGVYGSRGFRGINDFFTLAELRLHLVDMITASKDDNSSQRLFPRRAYNAWTRREGGRLGKIASFRDMLNHLNKFIFHNVAPCPMPKYEKPEEYERTTTNTSTSTVALSDTYQGREYYNELQEIDRQIGQLKDTTGPVRRNGLSRQFTSLYGQVSSIRWQIASWARENGVGSVVSNLNNASNRLTELARSISNVETRQNSSHTTYNLRYEEVLNRSRNQSRIHSARGEIRTALSALSNEEFSSTSTTTNTETVKKTGRLNCQIIRPDIFMVSPPRCNVIFPEFYNQFQTGKQWLRMVTRMRMTVSDEIFGPDMLLNNIYFAPDVEVLGTRVRQGRQASFDGASLSRAAYARRLMRHEHFTGPIPIFERMNEVNIVAAQQEGVEVRGARVPYVTRAANHQFFKHRFSPHSARVSGAFNPFIVCGFPAVVMDGYMTEEQVSLSNQRGLDLLHEAQTRNWVGIIRELENSNRLENNEGAIDAWLALRATVPTQYIGLVSSISHKVSQQSASTTVTLSSVRTHRDREELLGSNVIRRRDTGSVETKSSIVAAIEEPRLGMRGPKFGIISEVEELDIDSGEYHLFGTFRGTGPSRYDTTAQIGITQQAQAYGPEVVTLVGDPNEEVTFRPFRVTEEVDRTVDVDVNIPIEDFLRPPWMSDVWQNDQIGGVYQQLFGTGSITDPLNVFTYEDTDATVPNDPIQDGRTVQSAGMHITVERAIDLLVRSYSAIRHEGRDVAEFARTYIHRPIATMTDILGTRDLELDATTGEVTQGQEGFHSKAFGHGEMGSNIRNLIPPDSDTERILGFDAEDRREEMSRLDMRSIKAERVMEYVEEIRQSNALLG